MKYVQKLVLVPVERWEKIGDNIPVKEVLVKSVSQVQECFSSSSSSEEEESYFSDEESEKPGRFGDRCVPERNSYVSFSNSVEEGESIKTV